MNTKEKTMKRSDALLAIEQCLVEPHFPEEPSKEAEYILNKLEKMGMKPPLWKSCPVLLTREYYWEDEFKEES